MGLSRKTQCVSVPSGTLKVALGSHRLPSFMEEEMG